MDEAAQALESIRPLSQQLDIVADFQPPLLHYILHFATYISVSEWFLRTIGALIPGLISIYYSYKFADELFGERIAPIVALLLATSSFHIYFSQELRPYALPTALATASMYYFAKVLFAKNAQKFDWIALTISNTLGIYSSYLFPFFMISQLISILFIPKVKQKMSALISLVVSSALFLPLLPLFLSQLAEGGNVRSQLPGWENVVSIPQLKAVPLVFAKLIFGVVPLDLNIVIVGFMGALTIVTLLLFNSLFSRNKKFSPSSKLSILISWLIIPITTAWLISFAVPVVRPKRLLFILPALYIFIALGWQYLQKQKQNSLATIFLSIFFLLNIFSTLQYFSNPSLQRENWRDLREHLYEKYSAQTTTVVYSFPDAFSPMRWYELTQPNETEFAEYTTGYLSISDHPDLENDLKQLSEYRTILVFDYLRDLTDPNKRIDAVLLELGYSETYQIDAGNIGFVREFTQQDAMIGMR